MGTAHIPHKRKKMEKYFTYSKIKSIVLKVFLSRSFLSTHFFRTLQKLPSCLSRKTKIDKSISSKPIHRTEKHFFWCPGFYAKTIKKTKKKILYRYIFNISIYRFTTYRLIFRSIRFPMCHDGGRWKVKNYRYQSSVPCKIYLSRLKIYIPFIMYVP